MLSVPIDVWKAKLPLFLDPRALSHLSATCSKFRFFNSEIFVHPDYRVGPDIALYRACYGGHRDLAEWLVDEKDADNINRALAHACEGGHRYLAEWLVDEKGASDFNWALASACRGGHRVIAEWLINEKGASRFHIPPERLAMMTSPT